jgi:glutathione S-transferase
VDGDLVLFESAAICLHLVDRHPGAGLAPAVGSAERAHFYKWLIHFTNTIQPEYLTYFYPERSVDEPAAIPSVKATAEVRLGGMFDVVEHALREGGPYLLGEHMSAADLFLLMLCRWGRMLAHPPRERPAIGRLIRLLSERPAVARTFAIEEIAAPYC